MSSREGREIPPIGPDDESEESIVDRLVIEDMRLHGDYREGAGLELDDLLVPVTEEELAEGHPAPEIVGLWLESVQAHMGYFQVAKADEITIDEVQELNQDLLYNPYTLEDLVLIVKDELNQQDMEKPIPTILTFNHVIDASNRFDVADRLNEATLKGITTLAMRVFGQHQEEKLFRKAIESPDLARKIRRFAWILNQPFMEGFPDTVRRELALRRYEKRMQRDSSPVSMSFSDVLSLSNRVLRGMRVEIDRELFKLEPIDHTAIMNNRILSMDVARAIAVSETVTNINI